MRCFPSRTRLAQAAHVAGVSKVLHADDPAYGTWVAENVSRAVATVQVRLCRYTDETETLCATSVHSLFPVSDDERWPWVPCVRDIQSRSPTQTSVLSRARVCVWDGTPTDHCCCNRVGRRRSTNKAAAVCSRSNKHTAVPVGKRSRTGTSPWCADARAGGLCFCGSWFGWLAKIFLCSYKRAKEHSIMLT